MRRWLMMFSTVAGMLMASAALMAQQGQSSAGAKSTSKQPLRSPATMQVADKGFAPRVGTAGVPLAGIRPTRSNESPLLDYIPDEVFVVGAIQPAKLINAKVLRDAISKAGADDVVEDLLAQATKEMILNPSKIVEAAFFIDNESLEGIRKGLMESQTRVEFRNNLKQVGLAMHNFYDTYGSFPNSDGFGESKGNLSWRVHLLPYLEATDLYQQFNLDEPWDSENNKRLIAKMPDVFKVQGVDDPGKTSVHFLTGPGLPFGGEEDVTFRNVTDGTSNTIMTVVGGADTAQEWTKPGGLEIDPDAPVKALGNVADTFLIGLMDGSVRYLRADIDPQTFLHAAQHQDGNAVDLPWVNTEPAIPAPGLIVRYAEDFDQKAFVDAVPKSQEPEPIQIEGRPAFRFGRDASLMFVDKRTMLWSDEATLKRMLAKRGKAGTVKEEFRSLYPVNDGAAVSRLDLEDEEIKELFKGTPFTGLLQNLVKATVLIDATGDNESLLNIAVETESAQTAQQIMGLLNGGFQIFKGQFLSVISREGSGVPEDVVEVLSELVESVSLEAEKASVSLDIPKVEDAKKLMADLEPAIKEITGGIRTARARAKEYEKLNAIREIALAMHNYHAVFNCFPSWNTPQGKGDNQGLSWRVYLLPYFGEAELYNQFQLDEPWDSDHNKALIEKMPKIYRTAGVDDAGKTSLHVFLGEKTPLGGDKRTKMNQVIDGLSNTFMVIQAGPDKAEIWTKPSGLEYDPDDPKKCLGKVGDKIMVVMCDGFAKFIDATIDDDMFRRLIEHNDGEPVGEF